MKRLPNNALHKSLIKFLKEKQPVPVFDYLPEMAALPFITLGNVTVADQSAKLVEETKVTVAIHIWSDYKGRFEVNNIAECIISLLTSEQLDLSQDDFFVFAQEVTFYETYPEEDSGYNSVISFELYIQNIKED